MTLPLISAIVAAVIVLVIAAVVGLFKGKGVFGVLVDGRGKYSLSRLQILLWTALIIGGYVGIAIPKSIALPEEAFVKIPAEVLGLLGVTLGSTVLSTAIKANNISEGKTRDEEELRRKATESAENQLLRLAGWTDEELRELSPEKRAEAVAVLGKDFLAELDKQAEAERKPSWMDLFSQEQKGKEHLIDIGKLQMFTWTVAALIIYSSILVTQLTQARLEDLTELPNVTGTILSLMGISQAAYLGMKLPKGTPAAG